MISWILEEEISELGLGGAGRPITHLLRHQYSIDLLPEILKNFDKLYQPNKNLKSGLIHSYTARCYYQKWTPVWHWKEDLDKEVVCCTGFSYVVQIHTLD